MPVSLAKAMQLNDRRKAKAARTAANRLSKRTLVAQIPIAVSEALKDQAEIQDRYLVEVLTDAITQYCERQAAGAEPITPAVDQSTL